MREHLRPSGVSVTLSDTSFPLESVSDHVADFCVVEVGVNRTA